MSFLIILDSTTADITNQSSSDFSVKFNPPIKLGNRPWDFALHKANLWYSYYNISAEMGNNLIAYYNGTIWQNIIIPDGQYSIDQINSYVQSILYENGDYTLVGSQVTFDLSLVANLSTLRVNIILTGGYQIDLSLSLIYALLGFDPVIVTMSGDGPYPANINNDINNLNINCSLCRSTLTNAIRSTVIYTFVPESAPGTNINIDPAYKIYIPVESSHNVIEEIRISITDNLNRPINLNEQPTTYLLHFREATQMRSQN